MIQRNLILIRHSRFVILDFKVYKQLLSTDKENFGKKIIL